MSGGPSDEEALVRAAAAVEEFLRAVGAPVGSDPELAETGHKVAEAFRRDLLSGYEMDPATILGETTASTDPGMVVVANLPTAVTCPHHLMPALGRVHLGYLPGSRVAGFGALGRLVDCYSRRLSLQETVGQRIADALVEHLGARGAGCIVELTPTCMIARGAHRHGATTSTAAFAGAMAEDTHLRQEMLAQIRA